MWEALIASRDTPTGCSMSTTQRHSHMGQTYAQSMMCYDGALHRRQWTFLSQRHVSYAYTKRRQGNALLHFVCLLRAHELRCRHVWFFVCCVRKLANARAGENSNVTAASFFAGNRFFEVSWASEDALLREVYKGSI